MGFGHLNRSTRASCLLDRTAGKILDLQVAGIYCTDP